MRTAAAALVSGLLVLALAACGGGGRKPVAKRSHLNTGAVVAALHAAGFANFTVSETTDSRALAQFFLGEPPAGASQVIVIVWARRDVAGEMVAQGRRRSADARYRLVCNVDIHLTLSNDVPGEPPPSRKFTRTVHGDEDRIVAALQQRCA
ncbi:MAG TPA: hypothetical protein VHD91_12060 [Gaiellaceae bacterium]|nr:hypothetical protein [Gaiellaceae bacterium]